MKKVVIADLIRNPARRLNTWIAGRARNDKPLLETSHA
jgi:hypothetical protein